MFPVPEVCLSIHSLTCQTHSCTCLCLTACHIWTILSNVKHHVFLLRSKVNMKKRSMVWPQRTWALAIPLELAEIWTHAPFVQIKWGTGEANVTFPLFIFYCFVSIYISSDGSVIFTVLFGTFFESNVLYGCIFTCLLDLQMCRSKSFWSSQIKQYCFFPFGVCRFLVIFLPCWVLDASCMAWDVKGCKIRDLN